jgi:hypothetical protein
LPFIAVERPTVDDPHLPLGIFLATGRCTLVAAVGWIRRAKRNSVRAVIGDPLRAIHAKSQLTGGFQHTRRRGTDPVAVFRKQTPSVVADRRAKRGEAD